MEILVFGVLCTILLIVVFRIFVFKKKQNDLIFGLLGMIMLVAGLFTCLNYGLILDYGTPEKIAETNAETWIWFGIVALFLSISYFAITVFQFLSWLMNRVFPKKD